MAQRPPIYLRPRPLVVYGLALICATAVCFAVRGAAPGVAYAESYCGEWVPGYTGCPAYFVSLPRKDDRNWAAAQYYESHKLCEGVYIEGTQDTVSHRCGEGNVFSSYCELEPYWLDYELSWHVANNGPYEELIWGHASYLELGCT